MRNRLRSIPGAALLITAALVAVLVTVAWGTWHAIVVPQGNGFDFFPLWYGGRVLWQGQNPYTMDVAREIQMAVFGRLIPPGANQMGFAYPAYSAILLAPLLALPFPTAVTIWCSLQLVSVAGALALVSVALRRRAAAWQVIVLAFGSFAFRYPMIVYVIGQTTIWVLLAITGSLALYRANRDGWAGACLILAFLRPELALLPVLMLVASAGRARRWRFIAGAAGSAAGLLGASLLLRPTWPADFVSGVQLYRGYAPLIWPPTAIPAWAGIPLTTLALVLVGIVGQRMWRAQSEATPAWLVAVGAVGSLLIMPQTGSYTLTLALLPVWVAAHDIPSFQTRSSAAGHWILLGTFLMPWAYLLLRRAKLWPEAEHILIPLQVALALWLMTGPQGGIDERAASHCTD